MVLIVDKHIFKFFLEIIISRNSIVVYSQHGVVLVSHPGEDRAGLIPTLQLKKAQFSKILWL